MDTNLNRNDDPRLGLLPVIYQAPLLPHQYQHFSAVPALAVLLSTPKHWECPITDGSGSSLSTAHPQKPHNFLPAKKIL